jgi:hypothetical protein
MGKPKHSIEMVKTDLEIEEKIDAHKKGWTAQKAGLIFILAFILSAAAGVFGDGPASKARITKEQITVESERFYRHEARMELRIHVIGAETDGVTVTFPSEYLQHFLVDSILPEPKENNTTHGQTSYSFQGRGDMDITFYMNPQTPGTIAGEVLVNEKSFPLKTFVYP